MGMLVKFAVVMALGLALVVSIERIAVEPAAGLGLVTEGLLRARDWVHVAGGLALGMALGPLAFARWDGALQRALGWLVSGLGRLRRIVELALLGALCIVVLVYI